MSRTLHAPRAGLGKFDVHWRPRQYGIPSVGSIPQTKYGFVTVCPWERGEDQEIPGCVKYYDLVNRKDDWGSWGYW